MSKLSCAVEDCGRPPYGRGWCKAHHGRWLEFGDVRAHIPIQRKMPQAPLCSLGCGAPAIARGWCRRHYGRWSRTGDPGPVESLYRKHDPAASEKPCSVCSLSKPKDAFYKEPRHADGRASVCKACFDLKQRDRTLRRKYGVTAQQYDEMVAAQSGRCRICDNPPPPEQRGLVVDHCHTTGRARGLLCNNCNALLGMAADDVSRLRAAIDYLERSRE